MIKKREKKSTQKQPMKKKKTNPTTKQTNQSRFHNYLPMNILSNYVSNPEK